ncbi:STAS domain-containing protein [Streptomyces sp. NPDC048278]|uniref:STAS domain-containing protein n=1 Tax=Streptomyces sp. NPDC048278 TaxID=3155809 RepID=UPI0034180FA5
MGGRWPLLPTHTGPSIVLDMRGVTFLDSSGINTFINCYHALNAVGGWLRPAGAADAVASVIKLVGLDSVIDCHTTLASTPSKDGVQAPVERCVSTALARLHL